MRAEEERAGGRLSAAHTEPVDVVVDAPRTPSGPAVSPEPVVRDRAPAQPDETYSPDSALIRSVTVRPWHTNYDYYSRFRLSAVRFAELPPPEGAPTENVQFFSYMPQYSQLNREQFGFYLYLRREISEGRYPQADYSYIQLFIYETVNLTGSVPAGRLLGRLVSVWKGYRETYPRLDVQLSEWVCDFCLINRLAAPYGDVRPFAARVLANSSLREFWIEPDRGNDISVSVLMNYCSNYDYRKSKFCTGDNKKLYDRCMSGALSAAFRGGIAGGIEGFGLQQTCTVRDAYVGALCVPSVKKRLEIQYCSVTHSYELRFLVSDIMKYTENRVRAALGVRSRISHGKLPDRIRADVDAWFASEGPAPRRPHPAADSRPDYERLYDVESAGISPENAALIEETSWETTEALTEALGGDVSAEESSAAVEDAAGEAFASAAESAGPTPAGPVSGAETRALAYSGTVGGSLSPADPTDVYLPFLTALDGPSLAFLRACLGSDRGGASAACSASGKPLEVLVSGINALASDLTGDIILEQTGADWSVPDDYAAELRCAFGVFEWKTRQ